MVTVPDRGGSVYVPPIQRATGPAGIGASVADLAAELAALPTPALAEQVVALAEALPDLHDLAAGRFAAAAVELARRTLPPPPRRLPAAEAGARLVEAVERQAPPDQRWAAKTTCLTLELIDWRGHITPAGRRALRRLEAGR